jgi:crotonobetainyl-CoA:carnitine CoA-transferase CaiB-like acyl-CoA transferase
MENKADLPLKGLLVLEFSQYLSGPSAGLRLADLGARVIKIEHPEKGDACRKLAIRDAWVDQDSLLFHTINRNKESFSADLKSREDLSSLFKLIGRADVITYNFRPGVMEKLGLAYEDVAAINPRIIYGAISGYGKEGPWKHKPGQDLLIQSLSGLLFTSGDRDAAPTPFGLAIADILSGSHLVQGILAALIKRHRTGRGCLVEVSLMESVLDLQFELLTTYFASGQLPVRSGLANAHPLLGAPYGIYATSDGYLAIAMTPLYKLAAIISCDDLLEFSKDEVFEKRDIIKETLARCLIEKSTAFWLGKLIPEDIWCMPVLDWHQMTAEEGYRQLQMEQDIITGTGKRIRSTRCPIRWDGGILTSAKPAPGIGEHNAAIENEFKLKAE